jgi:hypothetical protein
MRHARVPQELCKLLEAVTDHFWNLVPCWKNLRRHEFVPARAPVALWVQDTLFYPHFGQWIVLKDKTVYDQGELTEHPISTYRHRNWIVNLIALATPAEEVIRMRNRKKWHAS